MMTTPQILHRELCSENTLRAMVAEAEPWLRTRMATMLREEGYEVEVFTGCGGLLEALEAKHRQACPPSVVVCGLSGLGGSQTLASLRKYECDTTLILVAGLDAEGAQVKAGRLQSECMLFKPLDLEDLRMAANILAEPWP